MESWWCSDSAMWCRWRTGTRPWNNFHIWYTYWIKPSWRWTTWWPEMTFHHMPSVRFLPVSINSTTHGSWRGKMQRRQKPSTNRCNKTRGANWPLIKNVKAIPILEQLAHIPVLLISGKTKVANGFQEPCIWMMPGKWKMWIMSKSRLRMRARGKFQEQESVGTTAYTRTQSMGATKIPVGPTFVQYPCTVPEAPAERHCLGQEKSNITWHSQFVFEFCTFCTCRFLYSHLISSATLPKKVTGSMTMTSAITIHRCNQ